MEGNGAETPDGSLKPAGRFARMESQLDRIESAVALKADRAAVEALAEKVGGLERTIEIKTAVDKATDGLRMDLRGNRRWLIGLTVGTLTTLLAGGGLLAHSVTGKVWP